MIADIIGFISQGISMFAGWLGKGSAAATALKVVLYPIAAIVGVVGTIGDLIESKFKRIAGVKDSGKIMPGHGGVLDRLDSVIFVAPFIFLFYKILYYVS
jgi:CDP-diglyceride synthetase